MSLRKYDSDRDYYILLDIIKAKSEISLFAVKCGLIAHGILWPDNFNEQKDNSSIALDRDICRAWKELGLYGKEII